MSDDADLAGDRQETELARAIAAARRRPAVEAAEITECVNMCGEKPRAGSKFCSPACLHDYELRERIRRRQGVR